MNIITLYHGSPEIVERPLLAKGKQTNDYGQGFYCTENLELAKEWASAGNRNGVANCYELDTDGLEILNLSMSQYNILNWLALLMKYRAIRLSAPIMKQAHTYLMEHYLPAIAVLILVHIVSITRLNLGFVFHVCWLHLWFVFLIRLVHGGAKKCVDF